jgi:hypothetical protein
MSGITGIGRNDEIVNDSYVQGTVSVTTSEIEAKVSGSRLSGRQMLRIYNASNSTVYMGPTGVTTSNGEPIVKGQWINIAVGDQVAVFLIASSGTNSVIVSEWA